MAKAEYWFNCKTNEVEIGKQSLSMDRIGPFESFEAASKALETLALRAKAIRDEDDQDFSS